MRAMAWRDFLDGQLHDYGKRAFAVTELANVAGASPGAVNVELSRLCSRNVLARYAQGIYGLPGVVTERDMLPLLDPCAYITGHAALTAYGCATQVSGIVTCFTLRRARRSKVDTPVGRFEFHSVKPPVYSPPADGVIASPEQALCDYVYLMRLRGVVPETVITFRRLEALSESLMKSILARYPRTTQQHVRRLISAGE